MSCLLGASIFVLLLLTGLYSYNIYLDYRVPVPYTERVMGIPIVEDLDFLDGKKKLISPKNPGIYFEKAPMPYDADGILYLSQNYEAKGWTGELTTASRDTFLCTLPDEAWEDKAGSIRDNHRFRIWMVGEDSYYELDMIVCGMPVMTLETQREELQDMGEYETDPDHYYYDPDKIWYGKMQLFDPAVGSKQYEITQTHVKYYLRGASSAEFDKKSYSLGLLDPRGENLDVSLLGMRSDNQWKLKSMVVDKSRVREKTACRIWEMFDQNNPETSQPGPRMEYIELLMDNDYVGIYGLVEPVDEKKLALDKNDILYKSTSWIVPQDEDFQYSIDQKWKIATFFRIRYPDPVTDYEDAWYPARDYLNAFHRNRYDKDTALARLDFSNTVDMCLFNMTISGSDNFFKNIYYAADVSEDGTYTMRQIPWDLDLTFGNVDQKGFLDDETVIYEEAAIVYFREKDPDWVEDILQKRWEECRASFLTTENILNLMYGNMDYIVNSGAAARENLRWPQYEMSTDLEAISEYQIRRMEWLDDYFIVY